MIFVSDKNGGAWLPRKRDVSPYLQVDLGHVSTVQQVATQGNPGSAVKNDRHKRWVTKFTLEFSQDGKLWDEYHESGELKVRDKFANLTAKTYFQHCFQAIVLKMSKLLVPMDH